MPQDLSGSSPAVRAVGPAPILDAPNAVRDASPTPLHAEPSPDLRGVRVGVVIPAYRVAPHVEKVIRGIPGWIGTILVVDDKSPDDTAAIVERLADPRVTLLRHPVNLGVGGAMASGFAEALRRGLDVVVKMDGDDQMDPAHLPAILAPLLANEADMVKCNRYASLQSVKSMPLVRVFGNAGLTFLVKLASGYWNTFDPANGYIAIRASVLEKIDLARLPKRYYFESGFLVELGILRAVVRDVPIPARYGDEVSSLSPTKVLLEFPPKLMHGFLRRLFWRYFVHDFTAVSVLVLIGVPLLLFGVAYAAYYYATRAVHEGPAPAGDVMAVALPVILGVQLLLQAVVLDVSLVPRTPISPPLASSGSRREPPTR
jgi:glycosyltransferase involved in cell wall biosynthesis